MKSGEELSGTRVNLLWAILLTLVSTTYFIYVVSTAGSPKVSGVITLAVLVFVPTAWLVLRILRGVYHTLRVSDSTLEVRRMGVLRSFERAEIREMSIGFEISDRRNVAVTSGLLAAVAPLLFAAYLDTGKMSYRVETADTVLQDKIGFVREKDLETFIEGMRAAGWEVVERRLPPSKGFRRVQYEFVVSSGE